MCDLTSTVFDFKNLTNDPKLSVVKLPSKMTIQQLERRLRHALIQLKLSHGRILFYQRRRQLNKQKNLIDLPQGTIKCSLLKMELSPIMELSEACFDCNLCGQQYRVQTLKIKIKSLISEMMKISSI